MGKKIQRIASMIFLHKKKKNNTFISNFISGIVEKNYIFEIQSYHSIQITSNANYQIKRGNFFFIYTWKNYLSIMFKVVTDIRFSHVRFYPPNKDFLDTRSNFSTFCFNLFTFNSMRTIVQYL